MDDVMNDNVLYLGYSAADISQRPVSGHLPDRRQSFICKRRRSSHARGGYRHRQSACEADTGASYAPAVGRATVDVRFQTYRRLCRPACESPPAAVARYAWGMPDAVALSRDRWR